MVKIGAIDKGHLDPVTAQNLFENVKAGSKQRTGRNHVIPGLQHRGQGAGNSRHAGSGGKGIFRPFKQRDPFLEHPHRRVAVTGIDEFVIPRLDEPRLGGLGTVIGKALRQKDGFAHFAILAAAHAPVDGFRSFVPVLAHIDLRPFFGHKKTPDAVKRKGPFILTF